MERSIPPPVERALPILTLFWPYFGPIWTHFDPLTYFDLILTDFDPIITLFLFSRPLPRLARLRRNCQLYPALDQAQPPAGQPSTLSWAFSN